MFFEILKRDIKRKKTMNFIITLFIILAVTFIGSSVNNLIAVTSSLESYFNKAGVADYITFEKGVNDITAADAVKDIDGVTDVKTEEIIFLSKAEFDIDSDDDKDKTIGGTTLMSSIDKRIQNYYDSDNNEINAVNKGELYLRQSALSEAGAKVGDKVTLSVGDLNKTFTVKGALKDAALGSMLMSTPRYLVNDSDFSYFAQAEEYKGKLTYIFTDDIPAVEQAVSQCDNLLFSGSRSLLKTTYIMEMTIAGVLLIVSVCLIVISLVILRFTITFTLSEEFREIGIMKAIGIPNVKIRGLYLVKYLAMSLVGAVIGFALSIPFGDMFLKQTAQSILMQSENSFLISAVCAVCVIAVIMLFCYLSTRKVKKFTPVDAIRNGTTGERYKKKGVIRLSTHRTRLVFFMAVNDILSGVKRFGIMLITFTIGILLVTVILNMTSTMSSGKLAGWLSMAECDAAVVDKNVPETYMVADGRENAEQRIDEAETFLKEKGYDASCFMEVIFSATVTNGAYSAKTSAIEGINTTTDMYTYLEGDAPQSDSEIAISKNAAEKLHAAVGDTVTVKIADDEKKCMVTAVYQSMTNSGDNIRICQGQDYGFENLIGIFNLQIKFKDSVSDAELAERIAFLQEQYPDSSVKTAGEYVDYCVGGVAEYLSSVKFLVLLIVIIINLLVAVLMEKSFLTKERGEIAMLKAIGFKNGSIVLWQTLRIGIIMVLATIIAIALSNPVGELCMSSILSLLGVQNIVLDVNIMETYVIYPLLVLATTVFSVFLTALPIRKINSNEINSAE